MILGHAEQMPQIDPDAWIAPDATIRGNVRIGAGTRVLHGARIVAEGGGRITIGRTCIVMENAVIRATPRHSCTLGDHCLVGPNAHLVGAAVEDRVFMATGCAVFHGAHLERGSEVRVHATVHLRSRLPAGTTVPIGWIAVGDPAEILAPDQHERIWAIQQELDFPMTAYGLDRATPDFMKAATEKLSAGLSHHALDAEG